MKSTASAALISAENTAARPIAPTSGGSAVHQDHRQREVGGRRAPGNRPRATMPEQHRHAGIEKQAERVQADAEADGAIVARAEHLLQQPGRNDERRHEQREIHRRPSGPPARTSSTPHRPARTARDRASSRRPRRAPAAPRSRSRPASPSSCTMLTQRRRQQPAGREVDRDHHAADRAADRRRHAGDDVRGSQPIADQLPGEDEQRPDPEQQRRSIPRTPRRSGTRDSRRRSADRARRRRAASPGRSRRRARASRSPPIRPTTTPRRRRVAERGGADRRSRADVRRQHRREDQSGTERASGDEEIRRAVHAPADPAGRAISSGEYAE